VSANVILIGPSGTGKTTIAQLLGAALNRPVVELDQLRWGYYNEIGYDAGYAQKLRHEQGMWGLAAYWKPFDIHAVERVLADYPSDTVISFGAGHSVYEDGATLDRAKAALKAHVVILLLPSPKIEESLEVFAERILAKEPHLIPEVVAGINGVNRFFLEHPSNAELATFTVYTKDKDVQETYQEIIERLNPSTEVS
jgi:hypothetical protein